MRSLPPLLAGHLVAGALALLAGLTAAFSPKGGTLHRWAGRLFLLATALVPRKRRAGDQRRNCGCGNRMFEN